MPSSLLIFGGTFDPPHLAHTSLPPVVARHLGCDRIMYVPAAANPLKSDQPSTAPEHRLAMLRLATATIPHAEIRTIELDRPGPSYTVQTLEALSEEYGTEVELRLLLGADLVLDFHRWRDPQRILQLATPAVMLRRPCDAHAFRGRLSAIYDARETERWVSWTVPVPLVDVTATEIRKRLAAGEDLGDLLEPAVVEYIAKHGLYRSRETT